MKPKAPKKKDTKPQAKSGDVIEHIPVELDWKDFRGEYHIYPIQVIDTWFKFKGID